MQFGFQLSLVHLFPAPIKHFPLEDPSLTRILGLENNQVT